MIARILDGRGTVLGDRRPYPVALVTLDADEVLHWARALGLPEDRAELAGQDRVRELVAEVVERADRNYAPPERIRDVAVLGAECTTRTGELTPTMKIRRNVVRDKYAEVVDAIHDGGPPNSDK
ncbi:long-chain fatty acid--CoA ligase [Amycolatopsis cihanbeyliensis]|uniref:long-chain fatty acid--CoA ligase n=1 Tax=Amycolatopsis cihanbeyliensis TaxID=1128664 RepID=UPI00114E6FD2|nr:long-chain fatty acid--CoA ligase [Amycolatopsis cihanbeyliensis]